MKWFSFAIILILSVPNPVFPQGHGSVTGIVYDSIQGTGVPYASLLLLDAHIGTHSDAEGKWEIADVPAGEYLLECSLIGYGSPKKVAITVLKDSTLYVKINLSECEYDILGSGICPVCGRSDQTIPIVYGEPTAGTLRKAKRGKVFPGGAVISGCDPSWYCKRDKVKF